MEKYNINITIEVKDGMEFDRKFIDFLETNTKGYELELTRIYTEEEELIIKDLIGEAIKNSKGRDNCE